MKNKWTLHFRYFLFWVLFFLTGKGVFLIYHYAKTAGLTSIEVLKVFLYGLRLDCSFAAYLSVIPFILFWLRSLFPNYSLGKSLLPRYTYFFLVLMVLLLVVDLELYQAWGFRLDATPLQYLNTPREMVASITGAPVFILLLVVLALTGFGSVLFRILVRPLTPVSNRDWFYSGWSLFLVAALILPIRGGWQQIPLNQSDVYFSDKPFANHAAINVPWNLMYSISKKNYDQRNPYQYFPDSVAGAMVAGLYRLPEGNPTIPLLNTRRPNVLFIILESYTAKLVGCLGGEPGVTPNLDRAAKNGILFDSIYASGDRSEKGMVALLSGYPVQTTTSIIKMPRKTEKLPHLAQIFKEQGYATSYYYGGELAFANLKSYLLNAGYQRLLSKFDFPAEAFNSKWGVHDHILFDRVQQELKEEKEPFFSTVYTLSSHEPYDIPIPAKFPGNDEATQFKNSFYYTDYALGQFLEAAQQSSWWKNTLVVLVADHGHRLPGEDANDAPGKFRIPLILTGGALNLRGQVFSQIGSQTDLAPTLLKQLGLSPDAFKWGKDLLEPEAKSFAFYVFNDGFGFVTPAGTLTFDNIAKKIIRQDPGVPPSQLDLGKAYMQHSFGDFLKK